MLRTRPAIIRSVMLTLLAMLTIVVSGCPVDLATHDRPEGATPCQTDADCNPSVPQCGLIRACVDLRCEGVPTRTIHCP